MLKNYDLHKEFYGRQDAEIETLKSTIILEDEKYPRTKSTLKLTGKKGERKGALLKADVAYTHKGYTNFEILADPSDIEIVYLDLGGQRFDAIHPSITGKLTFSILSEHILPVVSDHSYKLYFTFKNDCDIKVSFDIVKIEKLPINISSFVISSNQYTGTQNLTKEKTKIPINFNHPTSKLMIYCDKQLQNPQLKLNNHIIPIEQVKETTYEYVFNPPVNFSRIDTSYLEVSDIQSDTKVEIFGESLNIVKFNDAMVGLTFSK